jgi:hypothetical protein
MNYLAISILFFSRNWILKIKEIPFPLSFHFFLFGPAILSAHHLEVRSASLDFTTSSFAKSVRALQFSSSLLISFRPNLPCSPALARPTPSGPAASPLEPNQALRYSPSGTWYGCAAAGPWPRRARHECLGPRGYIGRPPRAPRAALPHLCAAATLHRAVAATSISATSSRASAAPPRRRKATCAPSPLGPSRPPLNSRRRPSSRPSPTKVSKPSQPPRLPLPFPQLIQDPQALGRWRHRWLEPAGALVLCVDLRKKKECDYALRPLPFLVSCQTCR